MPLSYIAQQITIYGGIFLVVSGVIGNGINIFIFSTTRTYRTTPCTFYFLIGSILNTAYLTINLIPRIVIVGYGFDLSSTSSIWCKIRQFCLVTLGSIAFTCSCLATIDQFFLTSQSAYLRRFSNIKWAYRIALTIIIVWCLHGIPVFVFYNISSISKTCVNTNVVYAIYIPTFLLCIICICPMFIMVIFGYLTYRNIRQTRILAEQQVDRQLTRMTLIQILLFLCVVPYAINSAYGLITSGISKDADRLLYENFVTLIVSLLTYFYYAGSFYMFLISSNRFRREINDRILFWLRPNRINPVQQLRTRREILEQ